MNKEDIYKGILLQVKFLFNEERDQTANLANTVAIMKSTPLPFFWIGFYIVQDNELILGPFQGLPASSRIAYGKGVCGTAWKEEKTQIVPDVHQFPGHIACNQFSRSEIVVPVFKNGKMVAVLDADSDKMADFDETDAHFIEQITAVVGENWNG